MTRIHEAELKMLIFHTVKSVEAGDSENWGGQEDIL